MPILLKNKLRRIAKVIRLNLRHSDDYLIVWWYCGICKNIRDNAQPLVLVAFRRLLDSQHVSDDVVYDRVPLTVLGQLRIGTVWKDGECLGETQLNSQIFDVDFTHNGWKHTKFRETQRQGHPPPYPHDIHPLYYPRDKSWLLEFTLPTGGKLLVPCLEFFTRCYGRSAELRRILATYSWKELQNERLYAPLNEPEEPDKWKIKLRKRLVNGDAVLLAHAKYESYTRSAVKEINAQIEISHDPEGKKPAFIKIKPWFQGLAKLKARGIWFDEDRSFLALQIIGGSDPDGIPIWKDRDNSGNAGELITGGDQDLAWSGMPRRQLVKQPDIIDLTATLAPDPNATPVEIEDPDFEILGTPRVVRQLYRSEPQYRTGPKVEGNNAAVFSSGDPHGKGQGVGHASIHAKPVLESYGVLRDMWQAVLFLKDKYSEIIQSVEWFTFEDGYCADAEPKLIAFKPFEKSDEELDSTTWKWPYMDPKTMQDLRGILIIRVIAKGQAIHILEIQRRPQTKKDKEGQALDGEESFQGLVFTLHNPKSIESWLTQLLSDTRRVKGVIKQLVMTCPGKATTFRHAPAGTDHVPQEAAARNALRKIGISLQ